MFGLKSTTISYDAIEDRFLTGAASGKSKSRRLSGLACGLVAGTHVATAMGWRPAEAITEGDLVLTFDRGLQPVRHVARGLHWDHDVPCPVSLRPLRVPAGALGNRHEMTLLPEQSVLVESDTADVMFGDPFALVAGAGLDGFRGIERMCPDAELEVIQLCFDNDEIVFANLGALAFCPSARMLDLDTILSAEAQDTTTYRSLPPTEAAMLIDRLAEEDAAARVPLPATVAVYAAAFA